MNKDYSEKELIEAMNIFDNPIRISTKGFANSHKKEIEQ